MREYLLHLDRLLRGDATRPTKYGMAESSLMRAASRS